jgi:histidinol phosphatase-like enzyme
MHAATLEQVPIDRVTVCYHGGDKAGDPCDCRKPRPGMLLSAELARAAKLYSLIAAIKESLTVVPDRVAKHLFDAAMFITNSQ